jgi:hypothetical protein
LFLAFVRSLSRAVAARRRRGVARRGDRAVPVLVLVAHSRRLVPEAADVEHSRNTRVELDQHACASRRGGWPENRQLAALTRCTLDVEAQRETIFVVIKVQLLRLDPSSFAEATTPTRRCTAPIGNGTTMAP